MTIVDISEVNFNDDYSYTLRGVPFTGLARECDKQGKLVADMSFKNGKKDGVSTQYFPSGRVNFEKSYRNNAMHGESREWFENGTLKRRTVHEFGFLLESDEWDEAGAQVKTFRLTEADPQYRLLASRRKGDKSSPI
jgi:antitoxin component YwqK of YwqJK toxin-antitoxin module